MDPKHIALVVVGSKLVPVFARFSEQIDPPDNLVDLLAGFLRPPGHGADAFARQRAESCDVSCPVTRKCAPHVRHGDFPQRIVYPTANRAACVDQTGYCHAASIQLRQRPDFDSAGAAPGS